MSTEQVIESDKSLDEVLDIVRTEAKNVGKEAWAEEWAEEKKKLYDEFQKQPNRSPGEHAKALSDEFKKALQMTKSGAPRGGETERKGELVAGMLPFIRKCGHRHAPEQEAAVDLAEKKGFSAQAKAIQASVYESAGVLVDTQTAEDFIEALYPDNIVLALGANTLDITDGEIAINKQNQTATAYWGSEMSKHTASQQTFGEKKLTPHKLTVLVPITDEMVDRQPQGMEALVRDDMVNVAQNALDIGFIRGDGQEDRPLGIYGQVDDSHKQSLAATPTIDQVAEGLFQLMYLPDRANVPMSRPGWMFHKRLLYFLMSLRTSDGFPIYQQELSQGQLLGEAVGTSTQIPHEKGGDGDGTEIYYGDFSQVVVGQSSQLRISQSNSATYIDPETGELVHSFIQDVQLTKLQTFGDVVLRHNKAFSVGECSWGAGFDPA